MPYFITEEIDEYESPLIKINIEYATFHKSNDLAIPLKLTIETNSDYLDANTRWELYFTDIPAIKQLYWLLRLTPKVVRENFQARLGYTADLEHAENKLNGLIAKFKQIKTCPNPDGYVHWHDRNWFFWTQFTPPSSQLVSIDYFVNKILIDLEIVKSISFENTTCICERFKHLTVLIKETNSYIKFLNRVCEDFLIFLRFFADIDEYAKMRKRQEAKFYNLEMEQYLLLKSRLQKELKDSFEIFSPTEITKLYSKLVSLELDSSKWTPMGYSEFVICPVCI
jgi:hypothetical protein